MRPCSFPWRGEESFLKLIKLLGPVTNKSEKRNALGNYSARYRVPDQIQLTREFGQFIGICTANETLELENHFVVI